MDNVTDGQSLLTRKEGIDFQSAESTQSLKTPFVVACIPAFNEEATIAQVVLLAERYVDLVLVCNDGSTDLTGNLAEAMGAVVILHEANLGYEAALLSLFEEAVKRGVDVVVTLDADGQDDPSEIPMLLERLNVGDVDLVVGSRFLEGGGSEAPASMEAGAQEIAGVVAEGGVKVTDAESGFRAYTRHALESLTLTGEGMGVSTGILLKAGEKGLRIAEVPIHVKHDENSSTQSPAPHGLELVPTTLNRLSIRHPLLFYGVPGFISSAVALVFWLWTLQTFYSSREVDPNLALVAVGASTVGLILLLTNVILWVINSVVRARSLRNSGHLGDEA
jgi:nucleotide-binding universal stress UspA family protein